MKRILLSLTAIFVVMTIAARTQLPRTVQGVPYTPKSADGKLRAASDWEWVTPDDMAGDANFTFDMIKNWTGEGENKAALVIQWNYDDEPAALVFGYRWTGQATGADMLKAVVKNNPRLYALMQYTNVSSPTDPNGGYTINGIGWDVDDDGDIALIDTGNGNQVYESEDGFFEHPRGYKPGQGGSSDYDYDNWKARDTDDMWWAGWYTGYWSYWVKDNATDNFSYSSWGASGRVLENGSWDGWNFAPGMSSQNWKSFVAAPLPIPADAKTVFVNEGLRYELKSYSAKTVKLTAPETGVYTGEVTVPSTFVDEGVTYTVVEVDKNAFANSTVTTVSLPATVTAIGKEAFKNSTIATLNVPSVDGVTKIGDGVFSGCSNFATLFVPSSMTSIPDSMFEGTAIAGIKFPAHVEAVGKRAFAACQKLAGVEIPTTITAIGEEAFAESNAITSVKVASTYPVAIADNVFSAGAYANATLEVPNGYTADYAAAAGWKNFTNVSEYVLDVKVGDIFKVGGMTYAVTAVGESNTVKATYCKVEGTPERKKIEAANKAGYVGEITIPASVTFQNVNFNVTEMSDSTFYGASELTLARIIAPVVSLGDYAFYDCGKLESVDLPSTLKKLGTCAFAYCKSIPSVTLPDGLVDFGEERTFAWCSKLSEINFPEGVTALPKYCFYGTGFPGIRLPSTIKTVGNNLFQSCPSLRKVIIEDGLTEIPDYMFSSCSSLVAVKMPDTATKIGSYVFQNCTSLLNPILPAGLTEVPNYMFSKCSALESINLPETVTSIGNYAFENCSSLEFSLPATVTNLGKGAFKNCKLIKEFTMPAAMTEIPNSLFAGCEGLTTLKIGESVNAIKGYAFDGCNMLANIVYADGQTGVNLPSTLTSIEAYAFRGCNAVGTLVLPEALASLPSYAFENSGLNRLVLPQKKMNYNNTNLVYGCKGIKVYSPVTEPGTTGSYTWRVKNGSPATFAEIVVPVGCKSAYSGIDYWGKSNLTELQLEEIQVVEGSAKKVGGNLVLSGRIAGTYDDAHAPAAFTQFNDGMLFKGKTVKVICKMMPKTLDIAKAASMTETTVGDDATFTVTVPDTDDTDMLRLIVQYEENGSTYTAGYPEMIEVEKTFAFSDAEYDAHFDESFTPTLVFYKDVYSLDKIEFSSSNTEVASVNKRTGAVSVKRVEGDAVITAALKTDPAVNATMTVHAALRNPVTGFVLGNGDKTINLTYLDILALSPTVEPANADIQTYDISVSDPEVATTYAAKAFNPLRSFWELITHKTGTVDVTFTSQDGSGASTTYTVNVLEPNREPLADSYQNGTFWLNEDWFGHSNGSINYITDKGELKYRVYEAQNQYQSFGCTSQYGIIHGDKLIVMSKQATDGGDPRKGGGRVVVADAKTLKKLAAFDYIGADTDGDGNGNGDGRACVGVSEDKVYLGSTAGIQVLDTRKLTLGGMVDGITSGENQYNGQIGDMVAIGKYAFAIQQGVGVHVIDIATDKVVKTFPVESDDASGVSGMGYPQGITVTADGNVWVATTADASKGLCTFRCIDPNTLDVTDSVELPEGQRVTCGWGAWRSTNFFASKSENAIWYGAGVEASIVSGNTGYYKWTVGSDIAGIKPVFVFPNNLPGVDSNTFQAPYAGVRYDDRKNQLLVAATHGASSNYRYNWLHFVDCKTGDIVNTIKLKDYYWFPSMPIFPDKYAPEFSDLPEVRVDLAKVGDIFTIDLKDYVTDKDNIDAAIRLSIVGGDAVAADNTVSDKSLVNATLENGVLTITPLIAGRGNLNVKAESNGKTTTVSIPYAVENSDSGIHNVDGAAGTLSVCDNIVTVKNMAGTTFAVYDMAGRVVGAFVADSDCARVALTLPSGVYVVAATSGSHTLKFSIK